MGLADFFMEYELKFKLFVSVALVNRDDFLFEILKFLLGFDFIAD